MTQQTVGAIQARKRPAMLGGLVGLVAVLGILGYFGFHIAMTPVKPAIPTASAAEIVDFVSNSRGLRNLSRVEQQKFLDAWRESLTSNEVKRTELKKHFDGLSDADRQEFTDSVFEPMKRSFVEDAKVYRVTPPASKYQFLRAKAEEYWGHGMLIKDVGTAFKSTFNMGPDEFQKWIIDHVTPEERAVAEPFYHDLQDLAEQKKKEQKRLAATQSATKPG